MKCRECGGILEADDFHGELVCTNCGLVQNAKPYVNYEGMDIY